MHYENAMKKQSLKDPKKFILPFCGIVKITLLFFGSTPPQFMLSSALPFQFRAEIFPTLSSDYFKMSCQFYIHKERKDIVFYTKK